ncbi:MAG TPA: hypothetical protein DGH25_07905 [Erwiniaceae bacterium]|uniref:Y-family DNA polymerase n=1 Tax=Mixta calida TaxID=665913 RepID=UPI0009DCA04F|nr:hypothetical protein [Pantoea sp.]POU43171.1 hypothetical protein C3380_20880 [Pantoea sp. PSNIH5]POU61456.1 hypothetical protein C3374_20565 [Pantoea sp. PSNIH4]POY66250.1 hypothetical protein C3402_19005 [Pantoea sp. PSNIH3]QNU45414.1 hypothetical protein IDH70_08820 [Mixta calida]HCW47290.1 hypothetical protein [Erwiniaceae bacterium]
MKSWRRAEIDSIDEAFIDLHGVSHCMLPEQFGHQLRDRVHKEAHLKVGVGIARTPPMAATTQTRRATSC